MKLKLVLAFIAGGIVAASILTTVATGPHPTVASADSKTSPTKALSEFDVYYPGTEDLAPDEMRVVALGTGMSTIRP